MFILKQLIWVFFDDLSVIQYYSKSDLGHTYLKPKVTETLKKSHMLMFILGF